jgi:hypothetical protein
MVRKGGDAPTLTQGKWAADTWERGNSGRRAASCAVWTISRKPTTRNNHQEQSQM